jgi:hypothetical protein
MEIQSLSVVVPTNGCINNCPFCVSRMHANDYENLITAPANKSEKSESWKKRETAKRNYINRLAFARDNGCNTAMLTGCGEPQQNMNFIRLFAEMNKQLDKPFRNIEIQTTGAKITEDTIDELANCIGITTVSLSVSCLCSEKRNAFVINGEQFPISLFALCKQIKKYGMNLRLSLNVTKDLFHLLTDNDNYNNNYELVFMQCKTFFADQITFRRMFASNTESPQNDWIKSHRIDNEDEWFAGLNNYVKTNGRFLNNLEYGNSRYSVEGMSVVIDEDCMAKNKDKTSLKYLILRPNCKLYTQWDDEGSLLF